MLDEEAERVRSLERQLLEAEEMAKQAEVTDSGSDSNRRNSSNRRTEQQEQP